MLHRWKKCSDILKVACVGGGEIVNLNACHFSYFQFQLCHQRSLLKCHCTCYIYGQLVKKVSFRLFKHALFIELSPRISRRTFEGQRRYILLDKTVNTQHIKNLNDTFWPMVHRCKKCSDISEVTSSGTAEIENVKNDRPSDLQCLLCQQMLLLKCHCIFYIGQKGFLSDFERVVC